MKQGQRSGRGYGDAHAQTTMCRHAIRTGDGMRGSYLVFAAVLAFFMAELITNDQTWDMWKGQMPVIYNRENSQNS